MRPGLGSQENKPVLDWVLTSGSGHTFKLVSFATSSISFRLLLFISSHTISVHLPIPSCHTRNIRFDYSICRFTRIVDLGACEIILRDMKIL